MIDFRTETFLSVCRCMNFTKAAEQLNITQPAVSQHIHYLEDFYRVKLFRYEGKRMFLTEEGKLLFQASITLSHDEMYLKEQLAMINNKKKRLVFGTTLTIGEFVIAGHLSEYIKKFPDTDLRMRIENTNELMKLLQAGEIDFALVEGNFSKKEYDYQVYSSERYIAVCGKNYDFISQPEYIKDLLNNRLIIREQGSGTREILEKNLESLNLSFGDFYHTIEIGGMNAIKSMVEAGSGITFLYEAAVKKEIKAGTIMEIKLLDFRVSHDFTFIWNKGSIFAETYCEIHDFFTGVTCL